MIEFELKAQEDNISLIQLLKVVGLARSGGEARQLVVDGLVKLNGKAESRKRAKLRKGDIVKCMGKKVIITQALE
ncbi:MAG: RNA-binding S4 domain-containing protein [Prevotellaceae bacterium]|jgi:ribosome-associated protein|nr:RNA-binding S4 domain-containing protein [Prevotellaceae bacterium]